MHILNLAGHDPEFGSMAGDHRLPLVYLRERRRKLVLALEKPKTPVSPQQIQDIAMVHLAIKAIEAVLAE